MARGKMKVPAYKPKAKGGAPSRSNAQNAAIAIALKEKRNAMMEKSKKQRRPEAPSNMKKIPLKTIISKKNLPSKKIKKANLKVTVPGSDMKRWAHKELKKSDMLKKIKKGEFVFKEKSSSIIPRKKKKK